MSSLLSGLRRFLLLVLPEVLQRYPSRAAVARRGPVPGRLDLGELIERAELLHPLDDQVPDAVNLVRNLTLALVRSAAGPVHKRLGAARDRAEPARKVHDAVSAACTELFEKARRFHRDRKSTRLNSSHQLISYA